MSIEQKLLDIKEIGKLALEGKSDAEIAKTVGMKPYIIPSIRSALGLRGGKRRDIFNSEPKAIYETVNGGFQVEFSIPRHLVEELGIEKGVRWAITGKITSKKHIELTIKPRI